MKKLTIKEFNRILENLIINSEKPTGNKFVITLYDVSIKKMYDYFFLWSMNEDNSFNLAGNNVIIIINGKVLTYQELQDAFKKMCT